MYLLCNGLWVCTDGCRWRRIIHHNGCTGRGCASVTRYRNGIGIGCDLRGGDLHRAVYRNSAYPLVNLCCSCIGRTPGKGACISLYNGLWVCTDGCRWRRIIHHNGCTGRGCASVTRYRDCIGCGLRGRDLHRAVYRNSAYPWSISAVVALVELQVRVHVSPCIMVCGFALMVAVGAG